MERGEVQLELGEVVGEGRESKSEISNRANLVRRLRARNRRVELTARDFEVLRFILDMKFASSIEVFEKFFRVRLSNDLAASMSFTKKRLSKLESAGFLRSTYSFAEARKYFVATSKAHRALSEFAPELDVAKPHFRFDMRLFPHDKVVLQSRLKFERELGASDWISDRMLQGGVDRLYGFNSMYVPDAVYRLPSGEQVAFEVEIAQKARSKYVDKILSYVELMRNPKDYSAKISRVHYLCHKKRPFEILKDETRIYGEMFSIELADRLLKRSGGF